MAEQRLDVAQIGAAAQQMRGASDAPQPMPLGSLSNSKDTHKIRGQRLY